MQHQKIAILDAPSNLGLRPPAEGCVPGCYKLPYALRDQKILTRLDAEDAGALVPPRYEPRHDPGRVRNGLALNQYSQRLANRITTIINKQLFPLVLGGDCSILIGAMLGLRRRGKYGLLYLDGHSDFRNPGNSPGIGAAAGEDLAIVTGRGQLDLSNIDGLAPYVMDGDLAALGLREDDEYLGELTSLGIRHYTPRQIREKGFKTILSEALSTVESPKLKGFWIHLDADIVDPELMPAVDTISPGGLNFEELVTLLSGILKSPRAVGLELTIFDPDLDPGGRLAGELADALVAAFK